MKRVRILRITQDDFLLANRRASRAEEIERHGKQIQFRVAVQKSKKVYDRNRFKRADIKSDDGFFGFMTLSRFQGGGNSYSGPGSTGRAVQKTCTIRNVFGKYTDIQLTVGGVLDDGAE